MPGRTVRTEWSKARLSGFPQPQSSNQDAAARHLSNIRRSEPPEAKAVLGTLLMRFATCVSHQTSGILLDLDTASSSSQD